MKAGLGFTMMDMLLSIAVLATLAVFALPLYKGYVETSNATVVKSNYEAAIRYVNRTFKKAQIDLALGREADVPSSVEEWISAFNPKQSSAPGGGPAFGIGGADHVSGRIGVLAVGVFPEDLKVIVELPGYGDLSSNLAVIEASSFAN